MKGWGSVSAAIFLCAGIAGADLVDARAVSVLCPPCIMPTTSEESDAFNSLMWDLQACNDSSCLAIGNAMGSISFSYVADDWSCIWHSNGCSGENFGDGTAWISRSGGDSTGQNALDGAIIAAHEAGHSAFNTSDDFIVESQLNYCLSLIG